MIRRAPVALLGLVLACAEAGPGPIDATQTSVTTDSESLVADGVAAAEVTVTVRDSAGKAISGVAVALAASRDVGVDAPETTDESGVTVALVRSTSAGPVTVTATAGDVELGAVEIDFVPGPAVKLLFAQPPADTTAGAPFQKTVAVIAADEHGNPVDMALTVALASDSKLQGAVGASASSGAVHFAGLTATAVGRHTITASADDLASVTSESFQVSPGAAARVGFVQQPTDVVTGLSFDPPLTVRLEDGWGNPVTGETATLTLELEDNPGADGFPTKPTGATKSGVAIFSAVVLQRVADGVTLKASGKNLEPDISAPFSVVAGPATGLGFESPPEDAIAGEIMPPIVVVARDAHGNPAPSFDGMVALTTGSTVLGAQLGGAVAVQAIEGVAVFDDLTLTKAQPGYTVKALAQDLDAATSAQFTVRAGAPAALVFAKTPPFGCDGLVLSPFVEVKLLDAFDNEADAAVDVTLAVAEGDGAGLSGTATVQTVHGVARFADAGVQLAEPPETGTGVMLSASSPELGDATSDPFVIWTCDVVNGIASYDSVPATLQGLKYDQTVETAIRAAHVQIVDDADGALLAEGVTSSKGKFTLGVVSGVPLVRVRIFSRTVWPPIRVQDNTDGGALYTVESEPFDPTDSAKQLVHAGSGWTGKKYGEPRLAAPFSILDTAYEAAQAVLEVRNPALPQAVFNWSVDNRPEQGNPAKGQITSTHFSPYENAVYLMGKQNAQTDEYDRHTIIHEWTHWLESNLGRSDSFGGVHWLGARIEPRLAFGEGVADAMPGIVLHPDSTYAMTFGKKQGKGWGFDVDVNAGGEDKHPGWFSEVSVAAMVYDVFDDEDEPWDTISLGLGPVLDVLTGAHKTTDAFTTIFTFMHALKTAFPELNGAINALTAKHSMSPVADQWGAAETNDGGWEQNLPVYRTAMINGASLALPILGEPPQQMMFSTRFIRFTGNGAGITVAAQSLIDVDMFVFRRGALLAHTANTATNSVTVQTSDGAEYVIALRGVQNGQKINDVSLSLTTQCHRAPVDIRADIDRDRATLTLTPRAAATNLTLSVYGIDGLVVRNPPTGWRSSAELDLIRPQRESNLVVIVEGDFDGVRNVRVQTFTVPAR